MNEHDRTDHQRRTTRTRAYKNTPYTAPVTHTNPAGGVTPQTSPIFGHITSSLGSDDTFAEFRPEPGEPFEFTNQVEKYQINDGSRLMVFEGVEIAYLSSERPGVSRWTDMAMFRTVGGSYIVNRIGVSAIIHSNGCQSIAGKNLPAPFDMHDDEISVLDRDPCTFCRPDIEQLYEDDPAALRVERDRHWAAVAGSAEGIIDALQTTKGGVKALSSLATGLIEQATKYDRDIAEAMRSFTVEII